MKSRPTNLPKKLLIALAAASTSAVLLPTALAQSNLVGSVFGQVAAGAGEQVVIENAATGLKRSVAVDGSGKFTIGAMPPGRYKVQLVRQGQTVSTLEIDVLAGQGAEAVFAAAGTQKIEITGRVLAIDVSSTNNGSVFTARQLDALPIATKDLNGVIALAANTVKADTRYFGGISIGGGGPSENAYYINGFPATNALTQLGSLDLPFGAIQQFDVQTGGFGAEFGRSVGGVVNIVTKSGSNDWRGGISLSVEPDKLRSRPRNLFYGDTGAYPAADGGTDGTIRRYRAGDTRSELSLGAYFSGPIVKDKLFFFFAADRTNLKEGIVNDEPQSSALATTGWLDSRHKNTKVLGKFDWNLTDSHRLEATLLGDNYATDDSYFGYDYATRTKTAYSYGQTSKNLAGYTTGVGGSAQILKYTGFLTDDLTFSALYGQSKSKHAQRYSFATSTPQIYFTSTGSSAINPNLVNGPLVPANPVAGGTTGIAPGAQDQTRSLRVDVEYRLGNHLLRAGLDENRLKSINAGESRAGLGGTYFRYFSPLQFSAGSDIGQQTTLFGNQTQTLNQAGVPLVGGRYYYVRESQFETVTNAQSNQSAQYLEDRWQLSKDLLLSLGLRNESFENKNGDNQTFLKMKSFISPRLAASWDVLGDSSTKVFGSAGRYSLQIPTRVAVRGASRSTSMSRFYGYTGVDPVTGAPTGLVQLSDWYSGNNEYGQAKNPRSVAAQDMKPTFQDEFTVGIEKALSTSFTGGAKLTYRKLEATIDDFCDSRPIEAYRIANGIPNNTSVYPFGCATINAGEDNTISFDWSDDGVDNAVPFHLSAAAIGLPKPKRNYFALDFFLEHPFKDGWYGKLTYTYSKSEGNTEGQTKSDNGQADVAVTSNWDFRELMEYADGPLPNDRTHQIKAYGYLQATPEWGFGATAVAESGRPRNCFGDYGGSGEDIGGGQYGAVFFYCDGQPSPRGSKGRLPWNFNIDASAVYKPPYAKGLSLRVDVFNLFNRQTVQAIEEGRDSAFSYGGVNPDYGRVLAYSQPRKVRLTAQYDF
jgi:TonB dependent receptor/Carboxypeptidase regulatory-like domain/TonB-dependent Receptor Plug Domain